jgi:hypothetical protein
VAGEPASASPPHVADRLQPFVDIHALPGAVNIVVVHEPGRYGGLLTAIRHGDPGMRYDIDVWRSDDLGRTWAYSEGPFHVIASDQCCGSPD